MICAELSRQLFVTLERGQEQIRSLGRQWHRVKPLKDDPQQHVIHVYELSQIVTTRQRYDPIFGVS